MSQELKPLKPAYREKPKAHGASHSLFVAVNSILNIPFSDRTGTVSVSNFIVIKREFIWRSLEQGKDYTINDQQKRIVTPEGMEKLRTFIPALFQEYLASKSLDQRNR